MQAELAECADTEPAGLSVLFAVLLALGTFIWAGTLAIRALHSMSCHYATDREAAALSRASDILAGLRCGLCRPDQVHQDLHTKTCQIHGFSFLVGVVVMLAWTLLHQFSVFLRATVASSEKRLVNAEHGDQLEQVEGSVKCQAPAMMLRSIVQDEVATITSLGRSEALRAPRC